MSIPNPWRPRTQLQFVRLNTIADLEMESGVVVRAQWRSNGRCIAWFPDPGQRHKHFIALCTPKRFRVVVDGIGGDSDRSKDLFLPPPEHGHG
jgi:hypothetical protein